MRPQVAYMWRAALRAGVEKGVPSLRKRRWPEAPATGLARRADAERRARRVTVSGATASRSMERKRRREREEGGRAEMRAVHSGAERAERGTSAKA